MKVSLVMATYNGEKYLIKQLDSIKNQTYQLDEVIIGDDCSSDNTVQLIKKYIYDNSLEKWSFYSNVTNKGFNKNFRELLYKATGELVFLCDQDDVWELNKVEEMINCFDIENMSVLGSGFNLINQDDEPLENELNDKGNLLRFAIDNNKIVNISLDYLLHGNFAQGCTMLVSKSIIDDLKKDDTFLLEHDWSLSLIAASKQSCYFLNKRLINYRIHQDNSIGLKNQMNNSFEISKSRMNKRAELIMDEIKRLDFIYQYLTDNDKQIVFDKKIFLNKRVSYIKNNKIKLIKLYLNKGSNDYYLRTFLGDIFGKK